MAKPENSALGTWIHREGEDSLNGAAGGGKQKCIATGLQGPLKPEITQILWQDGLRYLQLRVVLCSNCKKKLYRKGKRQR